LPAPTGVAASSDVVGQINITWDAQASATGGFELNRVGYGIIAYPAQGDTSYTGDTGATACLPTNYWLKAYRTGNNSGASDEATGIARPTGEFCDTQAPLTVSSSVGASYDQTFNICGGDKDVSIYVNFYSLEDRIQIYVDGALGYDSGCVTGEDTATEYYSALSEATHTIRILITPNCASTGSTSWTFTLDCV
jgi:hypothetical protein